MKAFRNLRFWILLGLWIFLISFGSLVHYGLTMLGGQIKVLWCTVPVEEYRKEATCTAEQMKRLDQIAQIRAFARDSLGMNIGRAYTRVSTLSDETLVWMLTACPPYALDPVEWDFPIIGRFSYKGFFALPLAEKEAAAWESKGYDISIDEAGGWSTLGITSDPILQDMLRYSEGKLAELLLHELMHTTAFFPDNLEYNENMAEFIGQEGAKRYLISYYGDSSAALKRYLNGLQFREEYSQFMIRSGERLDSVYKDLEKNRQPNSVRAKVKQALFQEFAQALKVLRNEEELPDLDNTDFIGYRQYHGKRAEFEKEFREMAGSDLKIYVQFLKSRIPK
jgi:predicted aminopeptidase